MIPVAPTASIAITAIIITVFLLSRNCRPAAMQNRQKYNILFSFSIKLECSDCWNCSKDNTINAAAWLPNQNDYCYMYRVCMLTSNWHTTVQQENLPRIKLGKMVQNVSFPSWQFKKSGDILPTCNSTGEEYN